MNYVLIQMRIEHANGNRIRGQENNNEYFAAAAMNPYDKFEPTHEVRIFDRNIVKMWKTKLPAQLGGLLPEDAEWTDDKVDMKDRIWSGGVDVEFDLHGEYCRTYTEDIIDSDGDVIEGKAKGDVICNAAGLPKVYTTIMVFCKKTYKMEPVFDENTWEPKLKADGMPLMKPVRGADGNLIESYVKGYSPNEVGENLKNLMITKEKALEIILARGGNVNNAVEEPDETEIFNEDTEGAEKPKTNELHNPDNRLRPKHTTVLQRPRPFFVKRKMILKYSNFVEINSIKSIYMKIIANREYALASTDVRDINNKEMRQMHELNARIQDVLDSHKPDSKEKKYVSDDDLKLMNAILSVFTKDFSDTQTSAFDEFLKQDKDVKDKPQPKIPIGDDQLFG